MRQRNPERVPAWREVIDAWKRSGQTINSFCRDRELARSNFDRWRRILAAVPTEPSASKASSSPPFVPLRVVAEPMAEVVLLSWVLVRLPLRATAAAVARWVAAVGAAAC
jgi:hypothetical protein